MKKLSSSKSQASDPSISKRLPFGKSVALLLFAGIALFGLSGYYWYQNVLTNPERVMSDMLDKSLQTASVYRTVAQAEGDTNRESTYTAFSPKTFVQSNAQVTEASTIGRATIVTETIGTQNEDYVRYASIEVDGDKQRDFSNIEGVWAKRVNNPETGEATSFLSGALLTIVPFGNFNPDQRAQLRQEIENANLYQYSDAKTEFKNGRPVMTYTVDLDLQSLIKVLAKSAALSGAGSTAGLDPSAYEGAQKVKLAMEVDVLSRHLVRTELVDLGRTESYSAYNAKRTVELPRQTIGIDELQTRLQSLEQPQQ